MQSTCSTCPSITLAAQVVQTPELQELGNSIPAALAARRICLIFRHFYGIGAALVEKFNSVSLRHISIIGFNSELEFTLHLQTKQ